MRKTALLCVLCLALFLSACASSSPQAALPASAATPEPSVPVLETQVPLPATPSALPVSAPAKDAGETVPESDIYAPYRELIERVEQGVRDGWTEITPEELGVSDVFKRTENLKPGWVRLDINGDGRDELLFGEIVEDGEASVIYDIFALPGDQLTHPVTGWEFNRWYLLEGGRLVNEVSGTGYDLSRTGYGFFNGSLVPAKITSDRSEYLHLSFESFGAPAP